MSSVGLSTSDLASLLGSAGSTSPSTANGINLSSLLQAVTGSSAAALDVTSAVNAAITAARAPETQWEAQQAALLSQEADLTGMSSATTAVENDLAKLNSLTGALSSVNVSSSGSNLVTAWSTGTAVPGTHIVNVSKLAATASWYSTSSAASSSSALLAGSFSLQVGSGAAAQISVTSGETMDQVASAVNGKNLGATASVVTDASGARLSIVSNISGSASDITIHNTAPQLTVATVGSAWNSASVADSTGATAGIFSIQVGSGTATQITATAGETLIAVAGDINGRALGVSASVVSDGSGNSRLAIVNSATGTSSGITVANKAFSPFTEAPDGSAWNAAPVADSTGATAGIFSIQVGSGTATQITTTAGESLSAVAIDINDRALGVTAGVVSDGDGNSHLAIVNSTTGDGSGITVANTAFSPFTPAAGSTAWNTASISDSTGTTSGSFSIRVGSGAATTITTTAGESLNAVASGINGQKLGVTASVVSDGGGSSHLSIVNSTTGNGSGITIANTSPQFTQATQGVNAVLSVDGIPISSASNTVTGAVSGLAINLAGLGTGVALSVTPDSATVSSAINQFVTDYNTLIGQVNNEFTYNASSTTAPPLEGNSTVEMLQNYLLGAGSYSATSGSAGGLSTLGSLGISMNNDGTLTVNSTTLGNAIQNNFSGVQNFFEGTSLNGFASSLSSQLKSLTDSSDGAFTVELSSMKSNYNNLQATITDFQNSYINHLQASLTAEYNAAEIQLQELNTTTRQVNAELGYNTSSGN